MKCGHHTYYVSESIDHHLAASLAKEVCKDHVDGLIVVSESSMADIQVTYFKSCGLLLPLPTEALMAVGRYCHEYKVIDKSLFAIMTSGGVRHISVHPETDYTVEADVADVHFESSLMGLSIVEDECIDVHFDLNGMNVPLTAVLAERVEFYVDSDVLGRMSMRELVAALDYHPMVKRFATLSAVTMKEDKIELYSMTSREHYETLSISSAIGVVGLLTRSKKEKRKYVVEMGSVSIDVRATNHGRFIVACKVDNDGSKMWAN